MSLQVSKPLSEKVSCCHCGEPCPDSRINQNDPGKSFCCDGCDTVYHTIQQLGLGDFYRIDEAAGLKINKSSQDWSWMDADIIREKLIRFSNGEVALVHWSLPSIHCRSCLWLLEKLPEILPGVHSVRVRMDRREADIRFYPEELALSQLASQLDGLGYAPKISRADLDSNKEESTNLRRLLSSKIGVAGFCAGNVMLLALPEYLGWSAADSAGLEWPVRIAQLLLILPILFYSASELFKSAWISLRRGVPSVDIPVVLGILALAARSGVALATGEGAGYLDSLAAFVFLLLVGRSFRDRILHRVSFDRNYLDFLPAAVMRKTDQGWDAVLPDDLEKGDQVRIRKGEILPADGALDRTGFLDYHFLTGETEPVRVPADDPAYAGGRLMSEAAILTVSKPLASTDLVDLWTSNVFEEGEPETDWTDRVARWFTPAVITLAVAGAAIWWHTGWQQGLEVLVSVLIVACPCGLALAAPFALGRAIRELDGAGLNLRDTKALEHLSSVDRVAFDKTGTLTEGEAYQIRWEGIELTTREQQMLQSICGNSAHPLSRRIAASMQHSGDAEDAELRVSEYEGKGLAAQHPSGDWVLGSLDFLREQQIKGLPASAGTETSVFVARSGRFRGLFRFGSAWRHGVDDMLERLSSELPVEVLTGDGEGDRQWLEEHAPTVQATFRMKPQDKLERIQRGQQEGAQLLMVGDGLNDAGALAAARAGLAVTADQEGFFPACDGVLQSDKVVELPAFLRFARKARTAVIVAVAVSVLYNLIGLGFALQGLLTPLVAAILMPLSSLTVGLTGTLMILVFSRKLPN